MLEFAFSTLRLPFHRSPGLGGGAAPPRPEDFSDSHPTDAFNDTTGSEHKESELRFNETLEFLNILIG